MCGAFIYSGTCLRWFEDDTIPSDERWRDFVDSNDNGPLFNGEFTPLLGRTWLLGHTVPRAYACYHAQGYESCMHNSILHLELLFQETEIRICSNIPGCELDFVFGNGFLESIIS